ncbi:Peptidoglycan-binding (PGRP) domain of peptidoglycan hydrolases-containing protein [Pseudobutyrivibrio sp. UC1225]|uniref:glycoside hydrolase domain-containing protein n=1 Tax=Pseudobutyrivibrio sp. UC1225 TaxID=1798185 RepID=UPI0008F2AA08|nr:glycoside hydrolase domain-containing protein [Pseudobutyrivibrio sp. UC1225]SFO03938.1 Peptidoglycan-binding (PGRP) domain of peptidoglycan hydrolases-containing protein [Pseudobutyrivibrio sp. UC1225]
MDVMVQATQKWLNDTYGSDVRFNRVDEDGQTGWGTIHGLIRALQIELGIQKTADSFGPSTQKLFKQKWPNGIKQQQDGFERVENVNAIIQGALWCKGYSTGASRISGHFYSGTGNAVKKLKKDMGVSDNSSTVTLDIMQALLSMDQFVLLANAGGTSTIRKIQQKINRDYVSYTGIIPTDGLYGRNMNKAMIKILQKLEGYTGKNVDGVFGNGTKSKLITLTQSNAGKNSEWFWLLEVMLICNGYDLMLGAEWNQIVWAIKKFQEDYCLPVKNMIDTNTWMSLFVSCGNKDRSAKACDTRFEITEALAKKIKGDGYTIVGRYLTGGNFKEIREGELKRILDNGLQYFPIFQENGTSIEHFTSVAGKYDGMKACTAAMKKGIPSTVIYFAVDCDVLDYQIDKYIIPYFKAINEVMEPRYSVGIYASRNVCTRVANANLAVSSFVSDMSTAFSGNLGFPIPKNWNYDQFNELKKYVGNIDLDKDAYSGRFPACSKVVSSEDYYKYELPTLYSANDLKNLTKITEIIPLLGEIEDAYKDYASSRSSLDQPALYSSEIGCLQYLAKRYFTKSGFAEEIGFRLVTAMEYDANFENFFNSKYASLKEKISAYLEQTDLWDGKTGIIDLPHLAVTTLTYCRLTINPNSWNGWAGDLVSAYVLVKECSEIMKTEPSLYIARAFVGGSNPNVDLKLNTPKFDNRCNYKDLCSDGYAIILAKAVKSKKSIKDAMNYTFIDKVGTEFNALLSDTKATNNDVLEIRDKVTGIVTTYIADYLSKYENSSVNIPQTVKDVCIWAYANWLKLLCN